MKFGLQFFPSISPLEKSADQYFDECLNLVGHCDRLGFSHVRTVEHYFRPYGGYSPNPLMFLCAASQRTRHARLIAGCVVPAFNHPLKLAAEIGMLDAISGGRLEVGFARAFLPHEFEHFGIPLDESRARFSEGIDQIRQLLVDETASVRGRFHSFNKVTSLPRPTQLPHPPLWIAAFSTPESFIEAGRQGCGVMAIPLGASRMQELIGLYRDSWRSANQPGTGRVMLAFHMFCTERSEDAIGVAAGPINRYLAALVSAASDWTQNVVSDDYRNYKTVIDGLAREDFFSQRAKGAAWVGSPAEICDAIADYRRALSGFDIASLQVNFNSIPESLARGSMETFSTKVMPHFRDDHDTAEYSGNTYLSWREQP